MQHGEIVMFFGSRFTVEAEYIQININTCRVMQLMTQTLNAVQRRVSKRVSTLEHKLMTC